ncbi:SpoIID/LytB domain-containing protein [Crocosphaera sp. XPORK-15E]|uniref:SpoIID/LytB domain-containing protein n=1 Tax=Crocosphaera sp. XPORK-15E TaxID=3110247 RepID=UPI002B21B5B0|nr:SpoIID/LytB domain-containing protein [Crocosphaera sp. XPORK-15E]MEA5532444.1 SpoIID/LytB domain-containing protein [Crocosphaera sp. XPORK-15E]
MKKFPIGPLLNRWGIWGFPLISAIAVPIAFIHWQPSDSSADVETKAPPLPALSQLQPPPVPKPPINDPSLTIKKPHSKLQSPQPQTSPKPSSPQPKASPKPPSPKPKAAAKPPSPPKPLAAAPVDYQPPPLEIRVAILRDEPMTTLGTSGQAIITDRNGRQVKTLAGSQGWTVQPDGAALSVGGNSVPGVVWVQPTQGSLIYVGDRWYRGKILLVSQGNSLLVVNYVDLEHYLYSVVGSEMHANAPTEALKAQAIAARSYALVHMIRPASSWYDLGNTQRWQVYKGLNSEYNTGHQAVQATMGQILSHQGGVVESLYASTDEIVARAHKGRGMSQTGAYELAKQGYDYQQILENYYPGVGLARLVLQN